MKQVSVSTEGPRTRIEFIVERADVERYYEALVAAGSLPTLTLLMGIAGVYLVCGALAWLTGSMDYLLGRPVILFLIVFLCCRGNPYRAVRRFWSNLLAARVASGDRYGLSIGPVVLTIDREAGTVHWQGREALLTLPLGRVTLTHHDGVAAIEGVQGCPLLVPTDAASHLSAETAVPAAATSPEGVTL